MQQGKSEATVVQTHSRALFQQDVMTAESGSPEKAWLARDRLNTAILSSVCQSRVSSRISRLWQMGHLENYSKRRPESLIWESCWMNVDNFGGGILCYPREAMTPSSPLWRMEVSKLPR